MLHNERLGILPRNYLPKEIYIFLDFHFGRTWLRWPSARSLLGTLGEVGEENSEGEISMNFDEIVITVKKVLSERLNTESIMDIGVDSSLSDDIGLDSMSTLTFLMSLEDAIPEFTIDANTLEASHVQSIASVCEYVRDSLLREGV